LLYFLDLLIFEFSCLFFLKASTDIKVEAFTTDKIREFACFLGGVIEGIIYPAKRSKL
jgi:hypothetical protein